MAAKKTAEAVGVKAGTGARLIVPVAALLLQLSVLSFSTALPSQAATAVRFSGAVSGLVTDTVGKPQPGAVISLFNQQDRLLQRVYTDLTGNFSFGELMPDLYSVRVSLASFVPATRDRVQVHPGMRSLLAVSLSRVFSSIQVVSSVPVPGGLMSDDWKWTLRSDSTLRPVLRLLPSDIGKSSGSMAGNASGTIANGSGAGIFHNSTGLVRISASDGPQADAATDEADLGTQFAFATSVYSGNRVHVSGDLGYGSATGAPAAAIRTSFSRQIAGETPTVAFTMRQMNMPARVGQSLLGGDGPLPALRSISVSLTDHSQISDALSLDYGSEIDTISFLDRMQYFSPWAKLTYAMPHGVVDVVFTSGNARPGLGSQQTLNQNELNQNDGLRNELAALSVLPRLSELNGHVKVQRGDDYEIGYSAESGSMEYRVSGYHQYVANTTLTIANPEGDLFNGDLLPSLFSTSALFNAGNISTTGFTVSATRRLGSNYKVTAAYGLIGVMTPDPNAEVDDAASLRRAMMTADRRALTLRATGTVRKTGTRFVTSYQLSDLKAAVPVVSFSTQPDRADPGLNVAIRQPIPFPGMLWRVEATADIRNILAQGYLPLAMTEGRSLLIVNNPRVFRGGLAFVF